ncbi:MAG TPA: DUF2027 domain-containing protein [Bacteroidales bacterium]|nr:DUF2027 domain-containing protein [Bacteroidales bacterium]
MTFKPGDKVKFLNDVGGGKITKIVKDQAYVMIEDGFDIPVPLSQIVKIDADLPVERDDKPIVSKAEQKKVKQEEKRAPAPPPVVNDDVEDDFSAEEPETSFNDFGTLNMLLGFVAEDSKKEGKLYHSFLINDCLYRSLYTFSATQEGHYKTLNAGMLENETKVFLHTFKAKELSQTQSLHIEGIFYKKTSYIPHEPLVYKLAIDTFKFSDPENYIDNDYFDEKAYVVNITEMDLMAEIEKASKHEQVLMQGKVLKDVAHVKKIKVAADNEEIDLHIEELTDDYKSLEASEILDIQMSKFHIALEGAIRNHTRRIIFIHGVGNGKLKFEIRKALDTQYKKYRYQDASFKEYGYGATMVILK